LCNKLVEPEDIRFVSLIKKHKNISHNVKFTKKVKYKSSVFTKTSNNSKICDFCVITDDGKCDLVEEIIVENGSNVFLILRKIV
jgi:hypothetical protein